MKDTEIAVVQGQVRLEWLLSLSFDGAHPDTIMDTIGFR
jgi:hypothetical protein